MSRALKIFALFVLVGLLSSCGSGRMYLGELEPDEPDARARSTGLRVGIRGLDRLESNLYQDALEREFERALQRSGMFAEVSRGEFDAADVDVVLRFEKADLSFRRRPNLAYFPLAFATLTLYIWVGGPMFTDTQYFDVRVHVERPERRELLELRWQRSVDHWITFYSKEFRSGGEPCSGPDASEVIADLIEQLQNGLRSAAPIARTAP